MKKPQTIQECFTLAEGVISRKKARKLIKRFNKLQDKLNDLRKDSEEAHL